MSKLYVSLPEGMVKNSVIGAGLSLGCYALLQFLTAFFVSGEFLGEETIFPAICVSAAVASFVGCLYSSVRVGWGVALSAGSAVAVFLVLTVVIALCVSETGVDGVSLTWVSAAMAMGGLMAAIVCGASGKSTVKRREKGRSRRGRK